MVINGHNHCDSSEKKQRCQDYIQALEDERRKIQVFQRELPLSLHLVTQAIETCKQQLPGTATDYSLNVGQSECSEQTSSGVPVFEEFMPIKRDSSHSNDDDEQKSNKSENDTNISDKSSKKSDWLRSVQLWNQTPDPPSKEDSPRKMVVTVTEVNKNGSGGAFHPFKKVEKNVGGDDTSTAPTQGPPEKTVPPASTSSTAETGGSSGTAANKEEKKDGQSQRKSRRCWSPELHRRFLQALQQLGGSHAATPKQIRELMKVDGLTNDEVKSHLQKYRLHTRRPNPSTHNNNNNNAQTPQFMVVGGIWVPPEYANMTPATNVESREASGVAQNNRIYAPIATLPPPFQGASAPPKRREQHNLSNSEDRDNHSEDHAQSHSPTASSSTHNSLA